MLAFACAALHDCKTIIMSATFLLLVIAAAVWPTPRLPSSPRPLAPVVLLRRARPAQCLEAAALCDLSGDGGCLMQQLQAALPESEMPVERAYVTVHFRATLLDGTRIHDSREKGEPLELRLGMQPSEAVPAWELALPQMRVGESARLVCAPRYAFGEAGEPPLIPPNATIQFELELLATRDLLSSNNTEEVDLAERYANLMADLDTRLGQSAKAVPMRRADEDDDNEDDDEGPVQSKKTKRPPKVSLAELSNQLNTAAAAAPGPPTAASDEDESPEERKRPPGMRQWIPSATRVEAEHPDGYSWRETDDELEVRVPLPFGATKLSLSVEIQSTAIRVAVDGVPKIEGALNGRLVPDECSWTIAPSSRLDEPPMLQLDLMKKPTADKALWGYILASERAAAYGFSEAMDDPGF